MWRRPEREAIRAQRGADFRANIERRGGIGTTVAELQRISIDDCFRLESVSHYP